jgi:hypothetical protein
MGLSASNTPVSCIPPPGRSSTVIRGERSLARGIRGFRQTETPQRREDATFAHSRFSRANTPHESGDTGRRDRYHLAEPLTSASSEKRTFGESEDWTLPIVGDDARGLSISEAHHPKGRRHMRRAQTGRPYRYRPSIAIEKCLHARRAAAAAAVVRPPAPRPHRLQVYAPTIQLKAEGLPTSIWCSADLPPLVFPSLTRATRQRLRDHPHPPVRDLCRRQEDVSCAVSKGRRRREIEHILL